MPVEAYPSPPSIRPPVAVAPPPPRGIDEDLLSATLCELGRVERIEDLGQNGPLVASAGATSLFHCLFGRDAIRMAMDLVEDFPAVAHSTLIELGRLQGVRFNPRGEEEPGRILHEHRHPDDPVGRRLSEHWDFPYYGSVDSTPQWINLLGAYCDRNGRTILEERYTNRLWRPTSVHDSLLQALGWILRRLDDPRGGGFLWVLRAFAEGIPNQVWEDSPDSYYHEDGSLFDVSQPYAPVAVQGYAYDALLTAADLLATTGGDPRFSPARLRARAARLKQQFLQQFWQPDLGTFALALTPTSSGAWRPARVVASAPGHLLSSRILDGPELVGVREKLVERLLAPDMLAAAGIRTKSTDSPRFRPGSYHNGSTWPMDTGVIADGFRRHGFVAEADNLDSRIVEGCAALQSFPEFFRGDLEAVIRVNTSIIDLPLDGVLNRVEQPPQRNQGWTATRVYRILRSRPR